MGDSLRESPIFVNFASLPSTPMNRSAKYDAASFIIGGQIRSRTNKQKKNTQTVNDISTSSF